MRMQFNQREIKEIAIATAALSVAFAFSFSDGIANIIKNGFVQFPYMVLFSFVAVGVGFLGHEILGHKLFGQKYGLHAEFRMWNIGLVIALLTSLFGIVFAAPGAVYIGHKLDMWGNPTQPITKRKMGMISVMGPIVNIVVAAIFLALFLFSPFKVGIPGSEINLWQLGASINIWLALFNMLPIPPLDGSKVLIWDKRIFIALFAALLLAVIIV